ncbi:peptidoglycan-binding protein [Streptomyces sp. NBC_00124]|uniref:peptidoglycan-binding protein n=1 Tax=Streptomyces sp. NBC_00124 TaxID=2975662 RepID=UPI002253178B|nr:peptidoglycan-binding protein [Streptomyces sp. NBC_00124]MCX5358437.1 peptidoglycan-binding protein [Streptomyces sp. NBC_00124]
MSQPTGPACAECGTPRPADGSLACSCARRASDAHRATRMAEAEAAEDFDPVRIRPFVEIGDDAASPDVYATSEESKTDPADQPAGDREDATSPHVANPDVPPSDDNTQNSPRRRRIALGTGVGAAAAVLLTGCFVGGLFWYDSPDRDGSLSGGVRAGLPDEQSTPIDPSSPNPSASTTSAQPSPSATPSPDTTSTAGPLPPTGTTPSETSSSVTATGSPTSSPSQGEAPVLRLGDRGPEVIELQLRLRQTGFLSGEADGVYDREVENAVRAYQLTRVVAEDESGAYGPATRTSLESETSEP